MASRLAVRCEASSAPGQGKDSSRQERFPSRARHAWPRRDLLGTVVDFSLRAANASICIVRSTGSKFDRQAKFVFSTDGSHAAAFAFVFLINL